MATPPSPLLDYDRPGYGDRRAVPGPIRRLFLSPPGWLLHAATASAAGFALYAWSGPAPYVGPATLAVLLSVAVAIAWFFRVILSGATADRFDVPVRGTWRPWAVAPIVLILVWGSVAVGVPDGLTFMMSREALDDIVANGSSPSGPVSIGWYGMCQVDHRGGVTRVFIPGAGFFLSSYGFVYIPAGRPAALHNAQLTPIDGNWYRFEAGFAE